MKTAFTRIVLSFLAMASLNFSNCKKDNSKRFCLIIRDVLTHVDSKSGTIIFYQKYNQYGVRIDTTINGNIDSQIIGLTCTLSNEFRVVGTRVKISGELKKFNGDEYITPQMAGDELYFLEITQIVKP